MDLLINDIIQACQERVDILIVTVMYAVIALVIVIMLITAIVIMIKDFIKIK